MRLGFQSLEKLRRAAWALLVLLLVLGPNLAQAHTSAIAQNLYAYCGNDPVNGCDPDGLLMKERLAGDEGRAGSDLEK